MTSIKIDKSFVDRIGAKCESSENICRTIIKMAHELGKESIAEGVETREQAEFLTENGATSVQGYLLQRSVATDEFLVEFVGKQDFHTQRRKAQNEWGKQKRKSAGGCRYVAKE